MAVLRPLARGDRQLSRAGQVEELDAVNNPEDPAMGTPQGSLLARAVDRAGRLPRGTAQGLLSTRTGARSSAALGLPGHMHQRRERSRKPARSHRGALHVRSRDTRRQHAGRSQGEGDDPLGFGLARRRGGGSACTTTCSPSPTRMTWRRAKDYKSNLNPEVAGDARLLPARAEPGRVQSRGDRFQFERLGYFSVDP